VADAGRGKKVTYPSSIRDSDDFGELLMEFGPPSIQTYRCRDGMCGAEDCERCNPEIRKQEPESEEE
jgi:hypothetical protein